MTNNVLSYDEKVAFAEVYDIIMFMDKDERKKIPTKFIEFIQVNKLDNYITKINPYLPLEFQKLSKKAQNIIAYLYRRYLANDEEKAMFREQEEKEFANEQKSMEENYNTFFNRNKKSDDIVAKPSNNEVPKNEIQNLPMEVEEKSVFKKFVSFLKKLLHIH